MRAAAEARGRKLSFGIRLHVIVRETNEEAWRAADELIKHVNDDTIATAQKTLRAAWTRSASSAWRSCMAARRDKLEIAPNLWAGVGLVRGGAGTALVGDAQTVAARIKEYQDIGIDTFILSGYPHLEEAYRFAELVFPLLSLRAPNNVTKLHVQRRSVRRDGRQRLPSAASGVAIMSLIDSVSLPRNFRLPRVDGLVQWIVPLAIIAGLAGRVRHRLRAGARAAGAERCRARPAGSCCCPASWSATSGSRSGAPRSAS